jgi:ubiquinone/menaquinone biosynthesis C-methylase UbiE
LPSQRDKAFAVFHYPCIGRWRFLDLYITNAPEYPDIIARLKAGETLLDVGCCFGHILRQVVVDGAPAKNLAGTDLRPEFIELGYELFRDKDTLDVNFVTGDVLDPTNTSLAVLDAKFDIVHSASFFHLFGWDDQVTVGERIVRFFKPRAKALVLGRQVGTRDPLTLEEYRKQGEKRYQHNVETLQKLWDVIGEKTGTKWKATGELFDASFDEAPRVVIRFAVFKLD